MKNRTAITLTAIAGLLTIGTAAEAATFTYSLVPPNVTTGVASDAIDSSLAPKFPGTISAIKNLPSTAGNLNVNTGGTGVSTPPPTSDLGGGNVGKNATNREALKITIPAVPGVASGYRLVSATFTNLTNTPSATAFSVGYNGKTFNFTGASTVSFIPGPFIAGTSFDFSVLNNDGRFRMTSATFEAVPEPLTILGTGFAAVALPALKKANKKAKK